MQSLWLLYPSSVLWYHTLYSFMYPGIHVIPIVKCLYRWYGDIVIPRGSGVFISIARRRNTPILKYQSIHTYFHMYSNKAFIVPIQELHLTMIKAHPSIWGCLIFMVEGLIHKSTLWDCIIKMWWYIILLYKIHLIGLVPLFCRQYTISVERYRCYISNTHDLEKMIID
jgi:hypothetical protein